MSTKHLPTNQHPVPTTHAEKRWAERTTTTIAIEVAWERGVEVSHAHDCEVARLYPPEDVVFLVRDGVIVTVVPANYDTLGTDDLIACDGCGSLIEWTLDTTNCPWCEHSIVSVRTGANLNIRYE